MKIKHARIRKIGKLVFVFNKWMIDRPLEEFYFENLVRFLHLILTDNRLKRGKYSL